MEKLHQQGRIVQSKPGAVPRQKRYLDEGKGTPVGTVWDDISPVHGSNVERTNYPTQKPLKLLDRILQLSSNKDDIILDAFCGCGTAITSAELLGRQWIGMDISPTACRVMAKRLQDVCSIREDEHLWKAGRGFIVRDMPWTEDKLRVIPPFEFENWAVIALGGIPNKVPVGDMGIDGRIYPVSSLPEAPGDGQFAFMDHWYPIQVKQKNKVGRPDIDQFEAVLMRERREKGFFVAFDYSSDAMSEIDAFFRRAHKVIVPLRVHDIIHERLAHKLA